MLTQMAINIILTSITAELLLAIFGTYCHGIKGPFHRDTWGHWKLISQYEHRYSGYWLFLHVLLMASSLCGKTSSRPFC